MKADQVSKEEIDELTQAMQTTAAGPQDSAGEVRAYDFARPEKLSKQNLRALELVFSGLARLWGHSLSSALKIPTDVQARPVEQIGVSAYTESTTGQRLVFALSMNPLKGAMLVDMPVGLILSAVDRMTGGRGEEVKDDSRPLTRIERGIVRRLLNLLLPDLTAAWQPAAIIHFAVTESYDSVADMELDDQQPTLLAAMDWTVGTAQHTVNLLVPEKSLETILETLDPQQWLKAGLGVATPAEQVAEKLKSVGLPVTVRLGRGKLSVQDMLAMEVGDVVRLEGNVNDPLQVSVGGRVMFQARPGLSRNRLAVQITGRAEDSQEADNPASLKLAS
jgi:flagellar motor switch protein FliM